MLVEAKEPAQRSDALRVGKQLMKNQPASKPRDERPPVVLLDLAAGGFNKHAILHAGGTGSFTGAAIQALINVFDEAVGELEPGLLHQNHLPDAAPRPRHLHAQ